MTDTAESKREPQPGLYLPFSTIVKILLALLFVSSVKILCPLIMTLILAVLLAVSLDPVVAWLQSKGVKRNLAIAALTIVLTGSIIAVLAVVVPRVFTELSSFVSSLPQLKAQLLEKLSPSNPLRPMLEHGLNKQELVPKAAYIGPIFSAGNVALGGLAEVALILVFSIYLVIDGQGVIAWLSAFFSKGTQDKIRQTGEEISPIIFSYVAGQLITSLLAFLYVWAALSLLHVPSALLLAALAGIFDILPVLGFFLAVIPAMLFAFPISGTTALLVLLAYALYHALENYLIAPAIYGNRLRVSSFVILVTLIASGMLAGIEGAIVALPIVASYPIIERIWLRKFVGRATIAEHAPEH
jgi:predicted PurR-regulated permease PerM